MLKFFLTLPIILSLYISFSGAQADLPPCAQTCAQTAANDVGCDINDPTCVCQNPAFLAEASGCVQQACSAEDAQAALAFFTALCGNGSPSGTGSTPPTTGPVITSTIGPSSSSVTGPVSISSLSTSGSVSSSSGSRPTTSSTPTTSPSSSGSSTTSHTGSSSTGSSGTGSSSSRTSGTSSSSSTSNLAATMPTHAAALVAGGIGALVAVVV